MESSPEHSLLNLQKKNALTLAAMLAINAETITGCPAVLSVAQWALESGWGRYAPGNNCFGIKHYAGAHGSQELATHEYLKGKLTEESCAFATFDSLSDCFLKHGQLIAQTGRYNGAFADFKVNGNLQDLAAAIAPIYAPGNAGYAGTLTAIMHMPDVIYALQAARASNNRALRRLPDLVKA